MTYLVSKGAGGGGGEIRYGARLLSNLQVG